MGDVTKIIETYYDESVENEWNRLEENPFEFPIQFHFMKKYIKPGDKVLDIGGGPGRYSIALAKLGCEVTLVDLSQGNVEFAKKKAAEEGVTLKAYACDARKIDTILQEEFDHVLLMGPLYHILEEVDRVETVQKSLSLLKEQGTFFAGFISVVAALIYYLREAPQLILEEESREFLEIFKADKPYVGHAFTYAKFDRTKDVLPFMEQFNLEKLHYFSSEGVLMPFKEQLSGKPKEVIEKWIEFSIEVCEKEELLNYGEHLMYIGTKR